MKILLTTHQFFPDHKTGTEVLTLSVARALRNCGHDVRILTGLMSNENGDHSEVTDCYEYENFVVYRARHPTNLDVGQSNVKRRYQAPLIDKFFLQILQDFRPELVHIFHLDMLGVGLITIARDLDVPIFMTPTDFWSICPTGQLLLPKGKLCSGPNSVAGNCLQHIAALKGNRLVANLSAYSPTLFWDWAIRLLHSSHNEVDALFYRADWVLNRINSLQGIIAPNIFMRDIMVANGVNPDLVTVSNFGIDDGGKTPKHPKWDGHVLKVGFIGTLASHKGCHVLIEAFLQLPAGRAALTIFGDTNQFPEYSEKLLKLAGKNPAIRFEPTFPNSEINAVISGLDVLIVPSIWFENTPLVVYSAQQAACPVIASDLPGIASVIKNDVNGLLFEANNSKSLATAIIRILEQPQILERLSEHSIRPKSTMQYVHDLLHVWERAK